MRNNFHFSKTINCLFYTRSYFKLSNEFSTFTFFCKSFNFEKNFPISNETFFFLFIQKAPDGTEAKVRLHAPVFNKPSPGDSVIIVHALHLHGVSLPRREKSTLAISYW